MQWLVLIHVLSAIIGVGPTFYGHVLLRKNQSVLSLRQSMKAAKHLEYFPKIGGTIAVLSGIILILAKNYGSFLQLWLIGALIIYIYIQIVVIAFVAPVSKKLSVWLFDPSNDATTVLPAPQKHQYLTIHRGYWAASAGGVLLFAFMIMKPVGL
jgi:uncharacterized membrane protein SirB2